MSSGSRPSLVGDGDGDIADAETVDQIASAVVDQVADQLVARLRGPLSEQVTASVMATLSAQIGREVGDAIESRWREQQAATSSVRSAVEEVLEALARQGRQASATEAELRQTVDRAVERAAATARGEGSPEFAALRDRLDDVVHRLEIPAPDLGPIHATLRDVHDLVRDDGTIREEFVRLRENVHDVVARATPDLTPLVDRLTDISATLDGRDRRDDAHRTNVTEALAALEARVGALQVDADPTADAVERLREQLAQSLPESAAVTTVVKAAAAESQRALDALRADLDTVVSSMREATEERRRLEEGRDETDQRSADRLDRLVDAVTTGIRAHDAHLDEVRHAIDGHHTDLAPVLDAVADAIRTITAATDTGVDTTVTAMLQTVDDRVRPLSASVTAQTIELQSIVTMLDGLTRSLDEVRASDRTASLQALADEVRRIRPAGTNEIRELLNPILDQSALVGEQVRSLGVRIDARDSSGPDLAAIDAAISDLQRDVATMLGAARSDAVAHRDLLDDVVAGLNSNRSALTVVRAALDRLPDQLPAAVDLSPALDALAEIDRRMPDQTRLDQDQHRIAERLDLLGDDLTTAINRVSAAQSSTGDALSARLAAVQRAIELIGDEEALAATETRLTQRVETNFASLRTKLDDQFLMADSVGANMSQLNAALIKAAEEPHQLRRDLDRTLDQLAEHLGAAMREMRNELHRTSDDPTALRSSVEAGLDRISGRFHNDASRILEAVTFGQEDTDGRLRRIDAQVNELRRAVDQVRRQGDPLGGDPRPQRD